jgi:mono/diheme cytochrome c family protein
MTLAAGLTIVCCFGSFLRSETAASVWNGIFTAGQAKRGEALHRKACASCHGDALEGKGTAPPLSGGDFKMNWNGQTVGDLFDKIQDSMPADQPGSLKPQENADILAFLLKVNTFPEGQSELPGDSQTLQKIQFQAAKPSQ